MSLNYLPGRPQTTFQATNQCTWLNNTIFSYCSGNNLIILSNNFSRLQTLYLEADCVAVDVNSENGFIAVAFDKYVNIYKPMYQIMKDPKWILCCKIEEESTVNCMKWGCNNDLVIGSNALSLWNITDVFGDYKPALLWKKDQPKTVFGCSISEDSQMLASIGKYDKTVKLWKRDSISETEAIFHLTILPHPDFVTSIRWKNLSAEKKKDYANPSQGLYTVCADKKLRIWICHEWNTNHRVQLWGSLQLKDDQEFFIVLDSWIVQQCLPSDFANDYYRKIKPDIVLLGSPDGNIEVHALEFLSNNPPKLITKKKLFLKYINSVSLVENPQYLNFSEVQPYNTSPNNISLIIHDYRGFIKHTVISVPILLSENDAWIGDLEHKLTGHTKSIQRLIRSSDGEAVLTLSRFNENGLWKPQKLKNGYTLRLKNLIYTETPIRHAAVHEKGALVICLLQNYKLQVWDCPETDDSVEDIKSHMVHEITVPENENLGEPLLIVNVPERVHSHERHFIVLVYSDGSTKGFEVSSKRGIFEMESNTLKLVDNEIHRISIIDPVHVSFYSDRSLLASISKDGLAKTFKATIDLEKRKIEWRIDLEIQTGIKHSTAIKGSSTGKLCVIDSEGKTMSIWDSGRSVLEYSETFTEEIKDNDWTSTEYGHNILSIGFTGYALLYTQVRYDYTNYTPSYLPIEKIDITSHTAHDIGDSIWMKDGMFACASGNQFYIKDKSLDLNDPFTHNSIGSRKIMSDDILHLSGVLNGPIPVFHPQFLIQALYAGKLNLVIDILMKLFWELRKVTFKNKDIANLNFDLDIEAKNFCYKADSKYPTQTFPDPYPEFNKSVSSLLIEYLSKIVLPYMTRHQQVTLISVAESVLDLMKYKNIVDFYGLNFLLGVKLYIAHKTTQKCLNMRDIVWALHSDNKELLLSSNKEHIKSWKNAKEFKIAYWATEADLIKKMEEIAKFEFVKDGKNDPNNCSIYYLALKKKQVLLGLWKMCSSHPEQAKMLKFMSHDFNEERWKTAALKNAYVLLSKHRYMEGAVFFLLGQSLKDCVNVLSRQVKDMDLAIAVCRLYEGDNGPVLSYLLQEHLLPDNIIENDKWSASYVYWKQHKKEVSIRSLITDTIELEDNENKVDKESCINKSFLVEDPALLILYSQLRKRNLKYLIGSLKIDNIVEYDIVFRVINILRRMGCDLLALSLIRNWEFIDKSKELKELEGTKPQNITTGEFNIPTTTQRTRKSLFDKIPATEPEISKLSPSTASSNPTKNLLDDFAMSSGKTSITPEIYSSTSRSILDDFLPPNTSSNTGSNTPNQQPKNLLDDFNTEPSVSSQAAPSSNIFDDFTSPKPSKTISTTSLQSEQKALPKQPPKPRNLLDDFM